MSVFSLSEFEQRIARVKQRMEKLRLDLLIVSHPANMFYLTGYDGWSFYVHQAVVLALEASQPIWVGREMDVPGAKATVWIDHDQIHGYPDHYVDNNDLHPMAVVVDVLRERGWARGRVGVEMDACYFTARAYAELAQRLAGVTLVDAWPMVNWVRIVKSPAELACMRAAGEIVGRAMQTAIEVIEPGVRENDAVAEITRTQIAGTPTHWGDYPATLAAVPSGAKSAAPHLTWTGDPFLSGAATNIELAGCHHRYHAALARTLFLGKPPRRLRDLAEVTLEGLQAAREVIRAGVRCEQVEAAWAEVLRRAGYEKRSRIGYSIGLNYPPDWGEQTASLRSGDRTRLEPDMCFHLMLGMWMDDWGFELSETLRVTEQGHELLTDFPQRLFTKS